MDEFTIKSAEQEEIGVIEESELFTEDIPEQLEPEICVITEDIYSVFVRASPDGTVTAINSSAFLTDAAGWVEIDSGSGDKFHHAQSCYLDGGLMDENGIYNSKLDNGVLSLRSDEEKAGELTLISAEREISELKAKLAATDYIAAKIAEGAATKEEYADKLAERAAGRTRINELDGT